MKTDCGIRLWPKSPGNKVQLIILPFKLITIQIILPFKQLIILPFKNLTVLPHFPESNGWSFSRPKKRMLYSGL